MQGFLLISDPDPYCEVICEGNKVKTSVCKSTKSPTWNERMTFYQKKNEDIKIEVWIFNFLYKYNYFNISLNKINELKKLYTSAYLQCTGWPFTGFFVH